MMFVKNIRTGIIMDEIDGMEARKECSTSELNDYINYNLNKKK